MPPLALMAGATALGGVASAVASKSAADSASDAAQAANDTERYIYDNNVALTEPQRQIGNNALAALAFESGLGPRPTIGGGNSGMNIQEIAATGGGQVPTYRPGGERGDPIQNGYEAAPNSTPARFLVGDQSFDSREQAQQFIDGQATNAFDYTPINRPDPNLDLSTSAFEASPGYQFRLDQGQQALERMAAAQGMRFSGAAAKDAMRFGQGIGSQEYGNFVGRVTDQFNRDYGVQQDEMNALRGLSGIGQTATQAQISAGNNYANAFGQNSMAAGNAQAQGAIGVGNAFAGWANNTSNLYGMASSGYLGQNPGFGITPMFDPFKYMNKKAGLT